MVVSPTKKSNRSLSIYQAKKNNRINTEQLMWQANFQKYTLQFRFKAGTSRGTLVEKDTYFIRLSHSQNPDIQGIGEASILKGLSIDDRPDFEQVLRATLQKIQAGERWQDLPLSDFPAIRFGLEMAWQDWQQGGKRSLFDTDFTQGKKPIPINGLIWMGDKEFMFQQVKDKLAQGFRCIKLKIGAIDFEEELALLQYIRKQFKRSEIELRVDANGAFSVKDALEKLKRLAELDLHSIEQPIMPQQIEAMAQLCEQTPLPIALDEELIGVSEKATLLNDIQPQYIILKPSLLGGWQASKEWIDAAEKQKIGWWLTSALESNIGLNAIAQWTATLDTHPQARYQGLGTGQLYHNNIASPLLVEGGWLHYLPHENWEVLEN